MEIDLPCNLLLAHTAFTEDDAVGICGGDALNALLYLPELFARARDKRVVKLKHDVFWLGIPADRFNELLVNAGSLHDIYRSAIFHHFKKVWPVQVVYYGDDREREFLSLLPVDFFALRLKELLFGRAVWEFAIRDNHCAGGSFSLRERQADYATSSFAASIVSTVIGS